VRLTNQSFVCAPAAVTPFCHGSSILALSDGDLLAAWFGGTWEAVEDTGIYLSRCHQGAWSAPELVVPPEGHAHGNAVLGYTPDGKVLLVYFRNYGAWCTGGVTFCRLSADGGRTWGPERPVSGRVGLLLKNKPRVDSAGALLLPVYDEVLWQCGIARSIDGGRTWSESTPVGGGTGVAMIQGALVPDRKGLLHMFMRTKAGCIYDVLSADEGTTWGDPFPVALPNPNSGIDALALTDGRMLMVYNPKATVIQDILSAEERNVRFPLNVALSEDDGRSWTDLVTLESEPGEFSYPAIVQGADGRIHIVYTYQRSGIRHAVLTPQ
jgi:predicted neuraminidase